MQLQDDRTEEQRKTHTWLVVMTDKFLSGWGKAKKGPSYAAWACVHNDLDSVESWVRSRTDAQRVRIVRDGRVRMAAWDMCRPVTYEQMHYRPSGPGHCHIYVVKSGHASLRR